MCKRRLFLHTELQQSVKVDLVVNSHLLTAIFHKVLDRKSIDSKESLLFSKINPFEAATKCPCKLTALTLAGQRMIITLCKHRVTYRYNKVCLHFGGCLNTHNLLGCYQGRLFLVC